MPRKPKPEKLGAEVLAPIPADILDQIVRDGPLTAAEVETATRRFKKALIERALGAELTHHLGYAPGNAKPDLATNHRNGISGKTVLTDDGPVPIEVPRDREGTFEPQLIGKHERRFTGFDDKVIALYARGLTVREIQAFLKEMYAVDVSPDLISAVTDAIVAEMTAWQSRPLEPMYPVVFFDALRVKIRDEATVRSKAVYLALAVLPDGTRDILGLWIEQTEGAKFWLKVFTDLKVRGCRDILIAVTDGLKGMADALEASYPQTTLQTCIVHSDPQQLGLCELEGAETARERLARDLHRTERRRGARRAGRVCARSVGDQVSDGRRLVAPRLGPRDSVLRVSARHPPPDLHDECPRERPCAAAQDHQDPRPLSERRRRHKIDLARPPQYHREMGTHGLLLETRDEPVCDPLSGSLSAGEYVKWRTRQSAWTLPSLWTHRTRPQRLGKPHRTRFPTAPTRLIVWVEEGERKQNAIRSITPHTQKS
jgi:putative transposase